VRRLADGVTEGGADPSSFRTGLKAGLVFALPGFTLAVSFGVLTQTLGWGAVAPIVSSIVVFSGSAQFAIADVLGAGGSAAAAIAAAILVNARFAPMGVALAPSLKGSRLRRAFEAQATVDSSWAIANRGGGRFDRELMLGATLPQAVAWIGGTAVGVFAGDTIGDPAALGLDVVFPAFFLGLLLDELRNGRDHVGAAMIGGGIALLLIPLTPPGIPVVAACVGALIALHERRTR
jgi:4-azaleucine resistance transporter AzlC